MNEMNTTREPQYQRGIKLREAFGPTNLGLMTNQTWIDDPKRLCFVLSRYKFVSKMLSGFSSVLEVGCADAFGTRVVAQEVNEVTAVDFDPVFVENAQNEMPATCRFNCEVHDMTKSPFFGTFQGAYSLDVIEHISQSDEEHFIENISESLVADGVLILGTPSIESQQYASPGSKEGHINCKNHHELRELGCKYFRNVFMFSMNDEVVHTGFYPMAHYLFMMGVGKRA